MCWCNAPFEVYHYDMYIIQVRLYLALPEWCTNHGLIIMVLSYHDLYLNALRFPPVAENDSNVVPRGQSASTLLCLVLLEAKQYIAYVFSCHSLFSCTQMLSVRGIKQLSSQ